MLSIVTSIIIGFVASIISSISFVFLLYFLRPKIKISPYISCDVGQNGNMRYRVKFINLSRRSALDVHVRLKLCNTKNVPYGSIVTAKSIPFKVNHIFVLPGYNSDYQYEEYGRRLVTEEDLEYLWNDEDNQYLVLKIVAKDAISGFSRVFSQRFRTKRNSFQKGSHVCGVSLDVA